MHLVDNWRAVLLRAWSTRFAVLSNLCNLLAFSGMFVFADNLDDWTYIEIIVGLFLLGQVFGWLVPPARIVKQDSLHADQ